MRDRDIVVLQKIIQYADEITGTISRFELNFEKFRKDYVVKNAVAMCVLQIGELVGTLTDEVKRAYAEMPWRDIVGMRNRAAHAYGSMDMEFLWNTAIIRVPELRAYCERIIMDKSSAL